MITYRKIQSVIPTNTAIKQARQTQSQLDKAKHDEYKEREVQASMAVNKRTTSVRRKGDKPFRPTDKDVKAIEATPEWKRLHRSIKKGQIQKSMAELMGDQDFTRHNERDTVPTPSSAVSQATYDDGKVIPQAGQWYHLISQDYYVMTENGKAYFISRDDFPTVKYLATKVIRSPIGLEREVVYASLGRVFDIINEQPSIDDLQKGGYSFPVLTLAELKAFGESDVENAIPLF